MPGPSSRHADVMQLDKHTKRESLCSRCNALCCRLTVVLGPDDHIPDHLTTYLSHGARAMAHAEDGRCVALDRSRMNCSIYETRPTDCRRFAMGGAYCNAIRAEDRVQHSRSIDAVQSVTGRTK
jgi:uncharacterized protein